MIPVHELVSSTLATVLRNQPLTPDKVAFAWRTAVGTSVERATDVELGTDGVLRVVTKDPAWEREVKRSRSVILARVQALLGEAIVTRIEVRTTRTT